MPLNFTPKSIPCLQINEKSLIHPKSNDEEEGEEYCIYKGWKRQTYGLLTPYSRTCETETEMPISTQVTGKIPKWLKGSLLQNGPGAQRIGRDEYQHLFDGSALLRMFVIDQGMVTYQNRFLGSQALKRNSRAKRIVVTEFGTRGHRDPCQSILRRFAAYFTMSELFSDNAMVGFYPISGQLYAVGESPFIHQINSKDLSSTQRVDLRKYLAVNTFTAHPHIDRQTDAVYNMGSNIGNYKITKVPKSGLKCASIVASVPSRRPFFPGYYHSFCLTDNFFIFIEQPLVISIPEVIYQHFSGGTNSHILKWKPKYGTRFYLISRRTGRIVNRKYRSDPFAFFHTINAFEDEGHVVVDVCCYDDGNVLKALFMNSIKEAASSSSETRRQAKYIQSEARRFVLPLDTNSGPKSQVHSDLNRLQYSASRAILLKDKSVHVIPEPLTPSGSLAVEMPQINYNVYNGKKYRFFYAICRRSCDFLLQLMKCDTRTKQIKVWSEEDCYPSEPIFVPHPNGTQEDDGVILSAVISEVDEKKGFLLILDAKTFTERGRASYETSSSLPAAFHGIFLPN